MKTQPIEQGVLDLVAGNVKKVVAPYRQGSVDIYMVSLDAIRVRAGFNEERLVDPRYPEAVREYADSMKVNGFFRHKPLLVCPADDGFLYITDGHTRWDAVQLANREGASIEAVPVVAEERGTSEEDRLFAKRQANSGRQLTPLGEAMLMKSMLGRGISEDTIARRWPCSITKVRNALDLLSVPTPVRDAVQAGEVSATEARKLVKRKGAGAVEHLQAAKAAAKAAGKKKVTPKALNAVGGGAESVKRELEPHSDVDRLNWIAASGGVVIRECYWEGGEKYFEVFDRNDNERLGEGSNVRAALDAAREAPAVAS